ncbi:MAG: hypothetical protein GY757_44845 [bacterium]|nr:hypothetical protein [bacterium]
MEVTNYIANPSIGRAGPPADPGNFDTVQILEDAGFATSAADTPLDATLTDIFGKFIDKTGIQTTSGQLKNEFLAQNPSIQNAVDLYSQLENTFAPKSSSQKSAIVDFLNTKIDTYFQERHIESPNSLSRTEAGIPTDAYLEIDSNADVGIRGSNNDWLINKLEMQSNFFSNSGGLNSIVNYFSRASGSFVDTYG